MASRHSALYTIVIDYITVMNHECILCEFDDEKLHTKNDSERRRSVGVSFMTYIIYLYNIQIKIENNLWPEIVLPTSS